MRSRSIVHTTLRVALCITGMALAGCPAQRALDVVDPGPPAPPIALVGGRLALESDHDPAEIFVDGERVGLSPVVPSACPPATGSGPATTTTR